ncbi:MAG: DUF1707 SHOCT-like domain-containing protein [Streptosporangiales bacterium]
MTESPQPGRRGVRIGDAEREEAVRRIGEHFAAGRLTEEEHSERTDQAYAARTQADLEALFGDLPGEQGEQGGDQPSWTPPWGGQWGAPPWAAATAGQRGTSRNAQAGGPCGPGAPRWLPVPFLVLAVIGSMCAIAHGFFPFFVLPLVAIAAALFFVGKRGRFGSGPWQQPQGRR